MNNSTILIKGKIVPTIKIKGKTNASIIKIYPELEKTEVTPTVEDQVLKPEAYGFEEVLVKGVQSYIDEDIKPEYIKEGVDILGVVGNFKGVDSSDATATTNDILAGKTAYVNNEKIEGTMQEYNGDTNVIINDKNGVALHIANKYCKDDITVEVDSDEINVNPTIEEQIQEGLFHKVTIGPMLDTSDATAIAEDILKDKTAYVNGEKVTGTMETSDYNAVVKTTITANASSRSALLDIITKLPNDITISGNSMKYMFAYATALTEIPQLDTSNVTDMTYAFSSCSNLSTIPQLDTSNVTNMQAMFNSCSRLKTIPQLDTSNVRSMTDMFNSCTNLKTIPQLDTSNVTSMNNIFYFCISLTTIPQLDTSNVTNMSSMFMECRALTEIPQLNTSKVTNMNSMFNKCRVLTTIPQLDTSNVTNMTYMFLECNALTTIPQLDTSNVITMQTMFRNCTNLSDESLNNILAMCINAVKITSNKTLKYISISSAQATRCQSLSNYQAFLDARLDNGILK